MKILVDIPAFNEEENIARILVKLQKITGDIVCNDYYSNSTAEIAERMSAGSSRVNMA